MINIHRWHLDLSPLRDEVGQRLGLDSCPGGIGDPFTHQLEHPFGNPSRGITVLDDLAEREG
jgi:hypothetical protein